jgi:hypothetical protein
MAGQCTPEHGGAVTGPQSAIAQELGWLNVFDYYGEYSDATKWLQESIHSAHLSGLPLYFPPTSGGVQAPYCITGTLVVTGSCHLFGQPAQSSFAQGGPSDYPVTGTTRAMIWTENSDFDMLCVDLGANALMENIDFCVLPLHSAETTASVMSVFGKDWRVKNSVMYGPMNGANCQGASSFELDHVTIIPFANETTGRFGLLCTEPGGTGPGPVTMLDCVIDQTQYPFSNPGGGPVLHTVDGIVVQANFASLTFQRCSIKGANNGFLTEPGTTGDVDFYFVMDSETFNCNLGINLQKLNFGAVHNCFISVDGSTGAPSAPSGIVVSSNVAGEVVLRNNIVVGNGAAPMIGMALEGPAAIVAAGGAILNCGEANSSSNPGDGIFIEGPAGGQYALGGIIVSGASYSGIHFGGEHVGTAVVANLALEGSINSSTHSGAGVAIDALSSAPSGITIVDCLIVDNDVAVANANAAVTTGVAALALKLANNTGYNPVGPFSGTPALTAGVEYVNNTGVDQSVYLTLDSLGVPPSGVVQISNPLSSAPTTGSVLGTLSTLIVPAGASITFEGAGPPSGWFWIGN